MEPKSPPVLTTAASVTKQPDSNSTEVTNSEEDVKSESLIHEEDKVLDVYLK